MYILNVKDIQNVLFSVFDVIFLNNTL